MAYTNSPLVSYTKLSPNHSGQRTHSIDRITPHCVVGQCSVETLGDIFYPSSRQASCQYGIGADGRVGMYVEEKNRSWCSSSNANDQRAVTIECASDTTHPYAFKTVVYNKLVDLCVDICKRNGKTKLLWLGNMDKTLAYSPKSNEMVLTVHRWFANKSCPGDWMYSRMGDLADAVTKRLGGTQTATLTVTESKDTSLYRVQVGAYKTQSNASKQADAMKAKGFDTLIVKSGELYKVQSGAFSKKANAEELVKKLKVAGFEAIIVGGTSTTSTSTSTSTASTDVPKTIWNYLKGKGLNDYAIAGIMGNLYAESALNPQNLQNNGNTKLGMTDAEFTAAYDSGKYTNFVKDGYGYGLAQWTYYTRKQALADFAKAAKKSIGDLGMQLDFLWKELQGYTSVMNTLKSAKSIKAASDAVLTGFERPADQGDAVKTKRASYGQTYYDKYATKTTSTASTTSTSSTKKTESFKSYTVKVTTSVLNVRKEPTTDSAITTQIKDMGVYTIVGESTGKGATKWGKLKSGVGWISLDYAKKL